MSTTSSLDKSVTYIRAHRTLRFLDLKEILEYRDLFVYMIIRSIKVLYVQTILGYAWAILNPLIQLVVFTIIFGRVAKLPSDGIPYVLFAAVAVIPWSFMSEAASQSSQSLVAGQQMLGKVYFPRIIFPTTPVFAKVLDFLISLLILVVIMLWYHVPLTSNLLFLPFFIFLMICVPLAAGLWLSALAIRFRDVKYATPLLIRMLMYSAPIVYSATSIPSQYRLLYSLNPIVAVIEGFRAALLGLPLSWGLIFPGVISTFIFLITGIYYFHYMEDVFVDVI